MDQLLGLMANQWDLLQVKHQIQMVDSDQGQMDQWDPLQGIWDQVDQVTCLLQETWDQVDHHQETLVAMGQVARSQVIWGRVQRDQWDLLQAQTWMAMECPLQWDQIQLEDQIHCSAKADQLVDHHQEIWDHHQEIWGTTWDHLQVIWVQVDHLRVDQILWQEWKLTWQMQDIIMDQLKDQGQKDLLQVICLQEICLHHLKTILMQAETECN